MYIPIYEEKLFTEAILYCNNITDNFFLQRMIIHRIVIVV